MRIAIIVLITIVVIEQLSFGVSGCNKNGRNGNTNTNTNTPATNKPKPKEEPTNLKNVVTIANGKIIFDMEDEIGSGETATVYAGKTRDGDKVVVKVFKSDNKSIEAYAIELECYEKMGAIIDDKCKIYGIPPIFYYGPGADSIVLVMPRYSNSLVGLKKNNVTISDESVLSIMQQLVLTLKYAHWKGVRHGDPHRGNVMVELNQVYLIDFGYNKEEKRPENMDIVLMVIEMSYYFGLKRFMREKITTLGGKMGRQKEQIISEATAQGKINPNYVRPLVEFAIEAASAVAYRRLPDYNKLYGIFDAVLHPRKDYSQRFVFNWLKDAEIAAARKIPIVPIESIPFNNV